MRHHEYQTHTILEQQINQNTTWMRRALLLAIELSRAGRERRAERILKLSKQEAAKELIRREQ